jgi:hypothetical protein
LYRLRAAQACYWPRETPEGLTKQIGNHKPQLLTDKLDFLYYFWPIIQCIITLETSFPEEIKIMVSEQDGIHTSMLGLHSSENKGFKLLLSICLVLLCTLA